MKRRLILVSIFFIFTAVLLFGQNKQKKYLYDSFITNKMHLWEGYMYNLEQDYNKTGDKGSLYELAYAQYGYIVYCLLNNDVEKAKKYLQRADANTDKLLSTYARAEIYSLKGALYGFKIEFDKWKAMKYGKESLKYIDKAYALDNKNARVLMEKGNVSYYIPRFLGGGIDHAISYHRKAVYYFERDKDNLEYNWLYLLVLTNLGRWYTEDGQLYKAKETYEKVLRHEPDFHWVKNELYPDINKRIKASA